jgi:TetR/AcrR family transcriptional regulator
MVRTPRPRSGSPADPPPSPPAVDAEAGARARIVAAATREFAECGFDGGRIDAIARAAGVNKALLYYYFPNKRELYRGLVLDHIGDLGRRLAAVDDPARPPDEVLRRMAGVFVELSAARPFAPLLLVREILNGWGHLRDEDFPVLLAQAGPIVGTVGRGVESGAFRPVPPLFVHLLLSGSMSLFLCSSAARTRGSRIVGQPDIAPDPRAYARFVADVLVRGLAAGPASDPAGATP